MCRWNRMVKYFVIALNSPWFWHIIILLFSFSSSYRSYILFFLLSVYKTNLIHSWFVTVFPLWKTSPSISPNHVFINSLNSFRSMSINLNLPNSIHFWFLLLLFFSSKFCFFFSSNIGFSSRNRYFKAIIITHLSYINVASQTSLFILFIFFYINIWKNSFILNIFYFSIRIINICLSSFIPCFYFLFLFFVIVIKLYASVSLCLYLLFVICWFADVCTWIAIECESQNANIDCLLLILTPNYSTKIFSIYIYKKNTAA